MVVLDMYHQIWKSLLLVMAIFPTWGMQNKVINNYYAFMFMDRRPRFSLLLPSSFFLSLAKSQDRKDVCSWQKSPVSKQKRINN